MTESAARRNGGDGSLSTDHIEGLLGFRHRDPHAVLGMHPGPDGVIVRAFRPEAERITVLGPGGESWPMSRREGTALFDVCVTDRHEVFAYELEVAYPGGRVFRLRDPYAFLPTLGELDLHLISEGRHEDLFEKLGAHPRRLNGVDGVSFALWAPNAAAVSVVGDFNGWDGRLHMMRILGPSGIWELFVPDIGPGTLYKFEVRGNAGPVLKTDPFAFAMENPPGTASIAYAQPTYVWGDGAWMESREARDLKREPMSIYEVHLGSWRRVPEEGNRVMTYREIAPQLADYADRMGFTHVEFLPVQEHPFSGSWGYQVSGYFAPTARYGTPDDFKYLVDYLHQRGVGVIVDWVPAHFPRDAFALARFDGTALYEHLDPRQGEHPDWGTYIFNYGRREVRNFLLASALYWLKELHVDGLRVDAVASMLYLDYSRKAGEWVPNQSGGRENLDAVAFLKELNARVRVRCPGTFVVAEESTAWAGVTNRTEHGGLGFEFKWNMGWMHDTLDYFARDPVYRRYHHRNLTFGTLYAWSERFMLPLSHDEVVHGKGSLAGKMPGDGWQKSANLRALFAYMWAYPGKKLLFMGGEFGQWREWNHEASLDWHLLEHWNHRGVQSLVRDLNRVYREEPALWARDADTDGFRWLEADDADHNVIAFHRIAEHDGRRLACVCNFSPVVWHGYRVGLPAPGRYREVLNSDAGIYGGGNVGNYGVIWAEPVSWQGQPCSASIVLPPLGVLWIAGPGDREPAPE